MKDQSSTRAAGVGIPARLALAAFLTACVFAFGLARAETERPAGLMWNRTGLPAVFPLQIKTTPGADYLVILSDAETDFDALAAYARGGDFSAFLCRRAFTTFESTMAQAGKAKSVCLEPVQTPAQLPCPSH